MKKLDLITKKITNVLDNIFLGNILERYKTIEDIEKIKKQRYLRYIARESGSIELSISALELIHADTFLGQRTFRHILKHNECNPKLRQLAAETINKRSILGKRALKKAVEEDEDYYVASACLDILKKQYKFVAKMAKYNSEAILRKEAFDIILNSDKKDKWKQRKIGDIATNTKDSEVQLEALEELKVDNDKGKFYKKNQKFFYIIAESGLTNEARELAIENINPINITGQHTLISILEKDEEDEDIKLAILSKMNTACSAFNGTLITRLGKEKNANVRREIIEMLYVDNRKGFKALVKAAKEDENKENRKLALEKVIEKSGKKAKIINKVEEYWKKNYPEEKEVTIDIPTTPGKQPVITSTEPTKKDMPCLITSGKPGNHYPYHNG